LDSREAFNIFVGSRIKPTFKNQDRLSTMSMALPCGLPSVHGFAVYDGHGSGPDCADYLKEHLMPRIDESLCASAIERMSSKPDGCTSTKDVLSESTVEAACTDAFASISDELSERFAGKRLGSTAIVALVWPLMVEERMTRRIVVRSAADMEANTHSPAWHVTVAWVGDSRGVAITNSKRDGVAMDMTEDHKLSLPREMTRCAAVHDHELATAPLGMRRTVIGRRRNAMGAHGPWGLTNEATGITVLVTRAFGDPLGASALSAVPDVKSFTFAEGTRLILASDGIWDAMDGRRASQCTAGLIAEQAARVLCRTTKKARYWQHLHDDDLSALVVDLGKPPEREQMPCESSQSTASQSALAAAVAGSAGGGHSSRSVASPVSGTPASPPPKSHSQRSLLWLKVKAAVALSPFSTPGWANSSATRRTTSSGTAASSSSLRVERAVSAPVKSMVNKKEAAI
jgi:serine/threonine protein phosphatase PrpC